MKTFIEIETHRAQLEPTYLSTFADLFTESHQRKGFPLPPPLSSMVCLLYVPEECDILKVLGNEWIGGWAQAQAQAQLEAQLGTPSPSKIDEFSEKFQTAFDPSPPPHFRKVILQFF